MSSSSGEMDTNYIKLAQLIEKLSYDDHYNEIKMILDSGYNVNYAVTCDSQVIRYRREWLGHTALHFCAQNILNKNTEVLERVCHLLLSRGADFTIKNHHGSTALHLAYDNWKISTGHGIDYSLNKNHQINQLLSAHERFGNPVNPHCKNGISHLHLACMFNNWEVVKFFLDFGVPVDQAIGTNSNKFSGYTCLHFAMQSGDQNMALLLLDHGADVTCLNAAKKSPLHLIIEKQIKDTSFPESNELNEEIFDNEEILDLLRTPEADDLNPRDCYGLSSFHVYCTRNMSFQFEEWDRFLDSGVDVNASLNFDSPFFPGYTPLHFAARCNFKTFVLLLESGANLLAKDANNVTPLDLCLKMYRPVDISNILKTQNSLNSIKLNSGALLVDVICEFQTSEKLHSYLKSHDVNSRIPLDSPLWANFTLLHLAVILSRDDTSSIIVCQRHGGDLSIQDANEMTILHLAFHLKKKKSVQEILYGCANILTNPIDNQGLSHLHIACVHTNKKLVTHLLNNGADPNIPIQKNLPLVYGFFNKRVSLEIGSTPLHIAIAVESDKLVQLLLQHGADPHLTDINGMTWMHLAFVNWRFYQFKPSLWLSPKIFKANPVAPNGLSHFHIACQDGNLAAVEALLPLVTNINEPISKKPKKYDTVELVYGSCTPLHLAVKAKSLKIVDLLLKNGADVRAKDAFGMNSLHKALHCNSGEEIIKRLDLELVDKEQWRDDDSGLTRLHVACFLRDLSTIETLLVAGEDVNSRIKED
ncbi:tankyrase-1-like, partial [Copidosoma floridanum]|uniref:tankyrase-1-like n=1 Tax=Copidosoma floridanum TaxID=29053 RepID=UPI000C6F76FD